MSHTQFTPIPTATGTVIYASNSLGLDTNDGLSDLTPVKTISEAFSLMTGGAGDHLLLKTGDTWLDESVSKLPSGKNTSEPTVLAWYGDVSDDRPRISGGDLKITNMDDWTSFISIFGINFHNYPLDPLDPGFDPDEDSKSELSIKGELDSWRFEDCKFDYVEVSVRTWLGGEPSNFTFHRNIWTGHYKNTTKTSQEAGRPSNVFMSTIDGLTFTENTFDYGGWHPTVAGAGANQYCHNMYIQYSNVGNNVLIKDNIVCRGASHGIHGRPGGLYENNFLGRNTVGLQMGYKDFPLAPTTFARAVDNVVSEGHSMFKGDIDGNSKLLTNACYGIAIAEADVGIFSVENCITSKLSGYVSGLDDVWPTFETSLQLSAISTNTNPTYTDNIEWRWRTETEGVGPDYYFPDRDLGTYYASITQTGLVGTYLDTLQTGDDDFDTFMNIVKSRKLQQWDDRYSADAINSHITTGLSIQEAPMSNILFTTNTDTPSTEEQSWIDQLALSHTVTQIFKTDLVDASLVGQDALMFSPACGNPSNITLLNQDIPVLTLNPTRAKNSFKMCDTVTNASTTIFEITKPNDPLAAELTGAITMFPSSSVQAMDTLAVGAEEIADINGGSRSGIIKVEPGAELNDASFATNLRVSMAFPTTITFSDLTADGKLLFLAAVNYVTAGFGLPAIPIFSTPAYNNNSSFPAGSPIIISPLFDNFPGPLPVFTSSNLPSGYLLDANTGIVTNLTPIVEGINFDVTATNSEGADSGNITFSVVMASDTSFIHDKAITFQNFEDAGNFGDDVSGFERDVVVTNLTRETVDGVTNAIKFPGVRNDNIDYGSLIGVYGANTELAWISRVRWSTISGVQILFGADDSADDGDLTLYSNGNSLVFQLTNDTSGTVFQETSASILSSDTWYTVAFTTGPSGWKVWLDTTVVLSGAETESISELITIDNWWLGRWGGGSEFPFSGWMKDIYLSNVEIDQATVEDVANNDVFGRDLIFLVGQSNMVGVEPIEVGIDDQYAVLDSKVDQWGFNSQSLSAATNTLDHQDETVGDMGPWLGMVRPLVAGLAYKRNITLVPAADKDTGFLDNDWNVGDTVYEAALASFNAAAALSTLSECRLNAWILGENDGAASMSAVAFQSAFNATIADQVTRQTFYTATTPTCFVKVQGPADQPLDVADINAGIDLLEAESVTRTKVETSDLTLVDNFHFNNFGSRNIGTRLSTNAFSITDPLVSIIVSGPGGTQTDTYEITIATARDILTLIPGNFTVTNGTIGNIQGSGISWTADITPTPVSIGDNDITLNAIQVQDEYGISNMASNTLVIPFDTGGAPAGPSETYYEKLIGLGFAGTIGMMQVAYLTDQGFTGDYNQAMYQHLAALGYTSEGIMNRLKQKQDAEGFVTIGEMMTKTGIIPV